MLNENHETESESTNKTEKPVKGKLISEYFDDGETILNQLKTITLSTILFKNENDLHLISRYDKNLISDYKNRMGVYISCLFDKNFDIFTPSQKFFKDYELNLYFEFYEPQFKIIYRSSKGLSVLDIGYDRNALPILECLETGIISRELFVLLQKMNCKSFDNGFLLSKCSDFRQKPFKYFYIKLTAGSELIKHFSDVFDLSKKPKEGLEFEKRALLIQNPKLCTDTSHDVARIYSEIDWRKKMWIDNERNEFSPLNQPKKKVHEMKVGSDPIDQSNQTSIDSYQRIFDSVFQNYQV